MQARVVVAVAGDPDSVALVRRGAQLAGAPASMQVVHVLAQDGRPGAPAAALATLRREVERLGGSFHTVLGADVVTAVADFATAVGAGVVVVGLPTGRLRQAVAPATGLALARRAAGFDVVLVPLPRHASRRRVGRERPISPARTAAGWLLAVLGPVVLIAALRLVHAGAGLPSEMLLFLALTVAVAIVGGLVPAVVSALLGFLTLNYFFTPPTGQLLVADGANLLALAVFVAVAVAVALVVDLAARRSLQATRAGAEAAALAELARAALGEDAAAALVSRLRETFGLAGVALLETRDGRWLTLAAAGAAVGDPEAADTVLGVDDDRVLALTGRVLARDRRVLEAFAAQAGGVLEHRRLREQAEQARLLEQAEATRTALLAAVSHDLRTPLATIRAALDGLVSHEVRLAPADTDALVATVAAATARLERLIDNLLDLSRLQTGSVRPVLRPTSLDEIVPLATEGFDAVRTDMPDTLPLVRTDPGLLERVIANVVSNAVRHGGGAPVAVTAAPADGRMELRVVDHGPGLSADRKARMFQPFQRLGDTSSDGLGLGLAVAEGLATAVGAQVRAEDTPGGGLTMVLTVPLAREEP
ncbi:ATP-binding protein [Georgenia thermotolerans]|uniref:ATP-binding protein n=1 Tax=Georgenia thermotolerans TaxID=527326 RepID=UPI001D010271|nr:ATP-binding protein [Georgenia thermotolerans]